jgi:DNA replication protein DnaC
MSEILSPELRAALRRLKLSPMTETLPERLRLARERALPYCDFLELILADECERRNQLAASLRAQKARLEPALQLEVWDDTAKITLDRQLLAELTSLRFLQALPTTTC